MSGYVERSVEERAEREGFAAFFPKPCSPDELAMGLRRVLDGYAMFMSSNEDRTKQSPWSQG
jgi:DNA-binding NarL/FixJ family response regulator